MISADKIPKIDKAQLVKKLKELETRQPLKARDRVALINELENLLEKSTWKVSDCKKAIEILFSLLLNRKR